MIDMSASSQSLHYILSFITSGPGILVKDLAGERSLFCNVILNVLSSLATILPRNREMVALL